ncbi:unnamed protein product [Oppiella nova]|uniref:NR LBD domain-containing protein n=1 Tax=Oppiella nova TaxID=334625 RepID=A0A7R9M4D8_9ACAR|nr:unnamed protein product [Oppiella nova]CAG2169373.1 unnamed protein product [Oppiella nova]
MKATTSTPCPACPEFVCHFGYNCAVNVLTRKFCIKCRLNKCLAMGMKKDIILNEEEREARYQKIQMNRKTRKTKDLSMDETIDSKTTTSSDRHSDETLSHTSHTDTTSPHIHYTDITFHTKHTNDYRKHSTDSQTIDFSDLMTDTNISEGQSPSDLPIHRPLMDYRNQFTELEGNKLQELQLAAQIFPEHRVRTYSLMPADQDYCLWIVMPLKLEQQLRRIVKMSKQLTQFNSICENDRISLIKYGFLELFYIRSVPIFNCQNDTWTYVMDYENSVTFSLDIMRDFPLNEWDRDQLILDLLTAIILFNPERPYIRHKNTVKFQQQIYMYLLKRYLLLKYRTESESSDKFRTLMQCLHELYVMAETKRTLVYLNYSADKVPSSMLREVFEIKSKQDYELNVPGNISCQLNK